MCRVPLRTHFRLLNLHGTPYRPYHCTLSTFAYRFIFTADEGLIYDAFILFLYAGGLTFVCRFTHASTHTMPSAFACYLTTTCTFPACALIHLHTTCCWFNLAVSITLLLHAHGRAATIAALTGHALGLCFVAGCGLRQFYWDVAATAMPALVYLGRNYRVLLPCHGPVLLTVCHAFCFCVRLNTYPYLTYGFWNCTNVTPATHLTHSAISSRSLLLHPAAHGNFTCRLNVC